MYTFLSQIPEDVLINKQKEVVEKFARNNVVYFISDGDSVKIGQAKNVFNRLSELQTGNPRRLIIVAVYKSCKRDINDDEKMFHEWFKDKNIRGEWFFLTDSDLYEGIGGIIKFPDYFCDKFWHGFYKDTSDIQRNINDRLHSGYCKNPYYSTR